MSSTASAGTPARSLAHFMVRGSVALELQVEKARSMAGYMLM